MADLGWRADGIDRARAAGGIELEVYTRPGFAAGKGVRRSQASGGGTGVSIEPWWPDDEDPSPEDFARRRP